jgi:1,4-dihydroxy-2-naphthoate octaprenyltransferase
MISARTSAPHGALAAGIWRIADPKITLASVASMIVGAAAAALAGPIAWRWLAATVLGIFAIEAAKNASGEIFDWDSGADTGVAEDERSPFSGGKRVIVDGLLTRRQTAWVALVAYAIGAAIGLAIAIEREPAVVWLGLLGVALAYFYHAPPLALAYRGLGELAVALAYGPVIAAGTYLVQRHTVDRLVLAPAVPLGLAIGAFLWVNEFPDARADAAAGKRTLVVRLPKKREGGGARSSRSARHLYRRFAISFPVTCDRVRACSGPGQPRSLGSSERRVCGTRPMTWSRPKSGDRLLHARKLSPGACVTRYRFRNGYVARYLR